MMGIHCFISSKDIQKYLYKKEAIIASNGEQVGRFVWEDKNWWQYKVQGAKQVTADNTRKEQEQKQ